MFGFTEVPEDPVINIVIIKGELISVFDQYELDDLKDYLMSLD